MPNGSPAENPPEPEVQLNDRGMIGRLLFAPQALVTTVHDATIGHIPYLRDVTRWIARFITHPATILSVGGTAAGLALGANRGWFDNLSVGGYNPLRASGEFVTNFPENVGDAASWTNTNVISPTVGAVDRGIGWTGETLGLGSTPISTGAQHFRDWFNGVGSGSAVDNARKAAAEAAETAKRVIDESNAAGAP